MKRETVDQATSQLYRDTVMGCLDWAYDMYPSISKSLVDDGYYTELEAYVRIERTMKTAFMSINRHLKKELGIGFDPDEAEVIAEEILHSDKEDALDGLKKAIRNANISAGEEAGLLSYVMKDVHDHRVGEFSEWFFRRERISKQFQFLPSELIGFEEFCKNRVFVEPMFNRLGIFFNLGYLVEAYKRLQDRYFKLNGITGRGALERHLRFLQYPAAPENVLTVIRHYRATTEYSMMPRTIDLIEAKSEVPWRFTRWAMA